VFAGVVLAVQCEGGEAGGGLADATGALGIALLGTAVAVFGVRAAVMAGLEDLEGLFESRHGGGCVWWIGSGTKLRDKLLLVFNASQWDGGGDWS